MKMKKTYITASVVLAAALGLSACATTSPVFPEVVQVQEAQNQVVTASGYEEVKVVPDLAEIVYAVNTQAGDAQTCQQQNAEEVGKVTALLKEKGIPETSIQTSGYGLNPRYNWNENVQTIIGYEMITQITVSDLAIDQVGGILGDSVSAGINSVESVSYSSSQYDEAYQEALKRSIEAASRKAETMAAAGGFSLDGIVHVEEQSGYQQAKYTNYSVSGAGAESAKNMDVLPGQVSVEARVSVDFKIVD